MGRQLLARMRGKYAAGLAALALGGMAAGCGVLPKQPQTTESSDTAYMNGAAENTTSSSMSTLNQKPHPVKFVRHGHNVNVEMYAEETRAMIAPGVHYPAWTFDGTVPGPVLYLQQGDRVTLTLHNIDPTMTHSIDLHAAQVDPSQAFAEIAPGKSRTIHFVATTPGVFMYHCESQPMALHIAQGMYGAVIVTPQGEKPPTFTIVQSEFYNPMDLDSVMSGEPNYVVFNGESEKYVDTPLKVKANQPVTVGFVNAGPNQFSAFHVVGTILRDVQASGDPRNHLYDVQTYTVAPGDGALVHLTFTQPGEYAFVSHSMSQMGRGAKGIFEVTR